MFLISGAVGRPLDQADGRPTPFSPAIPRWPFFSRTKPSPIIQRLAEHFVRGANIRGWVHQTKVKRTRISVCTVDRANHHSVHPTKSWQVNWPAHAGNNIVRHTFDAEFGAVGRKPIAERTFFVTLFVHVHQRKVTGCQNAQRVAALLTAELAMTTRNATRACGFDGDWALLRKSIDH
jgi:hypothetical protein